MRSLILIFALGFPSFAQASEATKDCDIPGPPYQAETIKGKSTERALAQCLTSCQSDKACAAMTFISGWGRCNLKKKFTRKVKLVMRPGTMTDGDRKVMLDDGNQDYTGKDLKKVPHVKTAAECGSHCQKMATCKAFVYMDGYGDCWLKDKKGRAREKSFYCWQREAK